MSGELNLSETFRGQRPDDQSWRVLAECRRPGFVCVAEDSCHWVDLHRTTLALTRDWNGMLITVIIFGFDGDGGHLRLFVSGAVRRVSAD